MIILALLLCLLAVFLAIYGYGRFARGAKGATSYSIPIQDDATLLDKLLAPEYQKHPQCSSLMLILNNLDAFTLRARSAHVAGRSIDIQSYIWNDDITGQLLALQMLQAADRGVRVRILLDDMNSHNKSDLFVNLDLHPNIYIRLFNPTRARSGYLMRGVEMLLRFFSVNRRMHNKAWIVDGRIAIVGGRNIGDEYFGAAANRNFFDADMLVSGMAVNEAANIFDDFWNSSAAIPIDALNKKSRHSLPELRQQIEQKRQTISALPYIEKLQKSTTLQELFLDNWPLHWSEDVHIMSDPADKVFDYLPSQWLLNSLLPSFEQSKQQLNIISPYFVPSTQGVAALLSLRNKGVAINVLTNSLAATDVLMVHGGYIPYRKRLLNAGVKMFEFKPFGKTYKRLIGTSSASLHTKAFFIDNQIGFIGSFNFDPRSANLNTEMGIMFREPRIITALQQEFNLRTNGSFSYQVNLVNNRLRWFERDDNHVTKVWFHEPESKWWQRVLTQLIRMLPLESQL